MNKTHVFDRDRQAAPGPSGRLATLFEGTAVGGAAAVVSQLHVLPPMWCFALLVAGLAVLGATTLLAARWYLPHPQSLRSSDRGIVAPTRNEARSTHTRFWPRRRKDRRCDGATRWHRRHVSRLRPGGARLP